MSQARRIARRLQLGGAAVPLILQGEAAECGLACLAMIAGHHGHRIDLAALRRRFSPSPRGVRLDALVQMASALHFSARPLRLDLDDLPRLRTPCILHWDFTHFVVLVHVRRGRALVHDPELGRRRYPLAEVSRHFTGIALELQPTPAFEPRREARRVRIPELWTRLRGFARSLAITALLSLLLQLVALASPFYVQLVVDDALAKSNGGALPVLALGFGLLLLLQAAVSFLREHVVRYAASLLGFQMSCNVLARLIRLPLGYFEKRHVGDVLSRFGALDPLQELLTTGLPAALIDGLMSALTGAMLLLYSPRLAAVSLSSALLYTAARLACYAPSYRLAEERVAARAREDSVLIETVRGMQPIKVLGAETRRENLWQNRRADAIRADVRSARWNTAFATLHALASGLEHVLVVYLGATQVLAGSLSVGMLYAFLAYRQLFSQRLGELVEWGVRYRMLDVELARLADIVHTPEEPGLRDAAGPPVAVKGRIELCDVSFRYSPSDPWVLRHASATLAEGSCVALVGRSGSGKTTLLKILLGLLEPSEGEVRIDGQSLPRLGAAAYRRQVGAVMQDDQLFDGTLAENISAFDPDEDRPRIEAAARAAQIHDDIAALPMGYRSLVGNMGANLSGGQRQRVLLARALYRDPQVLVLDEGTANLDAPLLQRLEQVFRASRATRILATHQPQVVALCERVLVLRDGALAEAQPPAPTGLRGH